LLHTLPHPVCSSCRHCCNATSKLQLGAWTLHLFLSTSCGRGAEAASLLCSRCCRRCCCCRCCCCRCCCCRCCC
jgi:hypothetical protein